MPEEIKEQLSKTEYDKVGEMLLELIAECPYIPADLKGKAGGILYQAIGAEKSISIITLPGGNIKNKNVWGEFTAELPIQIAYKSFPTSNKQRIDAQNVVDKIMEWLDDVENLPRLSGGRKVTQIISSPTFSSIDDVEGDKSTVFVANATMEYEVE